MNLRKKYFTLFEMLISAALLIAITVVLLRMFVLTGDYWHHSQSQSNVYIDSKILFNLLEEDLGNIIYNYENAGDATRIHAPLYANEFSLSTSGMTIEYAGNTVDQGVALYFVTRSKRGNTSEHSDICKVAYVFYPPLAESSSGHSFSGSAEKLKDEKNGMIVRILQTENDSADFTGNKSEMKNYFNFDTKKSKLITTGVLEFSVDFYKNESGKLTAVNEFDAKKGYENISAVRISVTMLPPDKCLEYRTAYQSKTDDERKEFLQKYSRTFSRIFRVSPMNSAE